MSLDGKTRRHLESGVLNDVLTPNVLATPTRAGWSDDAGDILRFAAAACRSGGGALATLVDVRGGAARALGAHVAVAADGQFCGYVSGGCVEAAVASEALLAMAEGRDRTIMFGEGSPFFDIVLPCGGGISVAIHVLRNADALEHVVCEHDHRKAAALAYSPHQENLIATSAPKGSGWINGDFVAVYRPRTRVLISGNTAETQAVARVAQAAGYDVVCGEPVNEAGGLDALIDPFTAVVLLHHDLDAEEAVLHAALPSPAFYIGALGSTRTHRRRLDRLKANGRQSGFDRIKAPIGLFGPTRDASSLALSVVADIAAARLAAFG